MCACVYVLSHLSSLSHFAHYFCYSAALVFVFAMAFSARSLSLLFRSIAVQMESQTGRPRGKYRERERLRLNIQYLLASFIYCSRLFIIIISILYCTPLSLSLLCCFIINFILLFSALCALLVACELKAPLAK